MQHLVLAEPVRLEGLDLFERPARITFHPYPLKGWWWRTPDKVVSSIDITTCRPTAILHCLTLCRRRYWLSIYEHIGALKWTGLTGVVVNSTPLPPYDGRVGDQWGALWPRTTATGQPIWWVTGRDNSGVTIPHAKVQNGFIQYRPSYFPELQVTIRLNYPQLGSYELVWQSPTNSPTPAFAAYTQGYSQGLQRLLALLRWAHYGKVNWNDGSWSAQGLLHQFALHRLADLLGTLSLVTHDKLLAGNIISYGAGHSEDLRLVRGIVQGGLNVLPQ